MATPLIDFRHMGVALSNCLFTPEDDRQGKG